MSFAHNGGAGGAAMTKKLLILFSVVLMFPVRLSAEPANYTYNYDFWDEQVSSPDAYRVGAYILGSALGIGSFRDPQGLFIRGDRIYICDSGNNRIVLLRALADGGYAVAAVVSSVRINGVESAFNYPMDIFEARNGFLYIADTENRRILKLDRDWNYVSSILKPDDQSIGENAEFLPVKLVVDFANRLFAQARNINKGLMEFDSRGAFVGYMGANRVYVSIIDYAWKLVSTQAQKERMDLFIPTEYNNLCLDRDGFIYVTNSAGQTDPVRRLNAMGQDILIRNGYEDPEGDLAYGNAAGISGRSRFVDVTALDNDSYACLDRVRGRVFMYDFQGNLLYAFGGVGNREGCFLQPVALDHIGYSLYVLDSRSAALTCFELTGYGATINAALGEYQAGRYESSAEQWEAVLKMNGNYDLAYIGIGRAALRQGEYQKAMKYYKLKRYSEGYGKAFQLYRKQWMEANLWKILLALALLIIVPRLIKWVLRIRKEVLEA
jgi:DNA-binding beta-propeller fold protein YncE